jgi:hypothetical protein
MLNAGTISTLQSGTLNTLNSGTLNTLNSGTLNTIGSAAVYTKHDLKVYDALGTFVTVAGTLVQTASKIIKVHHYRAQTDGTWAFKFADTIPTGGTLDCGWIFNQREGVVTPFVPYPGYLFKSTTAGSALCLGTWAACSGTLRLSLISTDDDTS